MAAELARDGVRVNAVAPGMTETDMLHQNSEEAINTFTDRSLMHRNGNPREIAQVILFLASDMSSFITGQTVRIDGGML
jgi:3-oxoacyl-[acyl-carrier protein] reductase